MKHFLIDPKTVLGGIVYTNEKQEVVHLSLLAGNTVPEYSANAEIDLFVIQGCVELQLEKEQTAETIRTGELVILEANTVHSMTAVEDSQILAFKVK